MGNLLYAPCTRGHVSGKVNTVQLIEEEEDMSEEQNGMGAGMVLLSFVVGAALGSTLVLLLQKSEENKDETSQDDSPLFI